MKLDRLAKPRTALVFIEFQREWIAADGILRNRLVVDHAAFDHAVEQAGAVLEAARTHDWTIAHAGLDLRHDPRYRLFHCGSDVLGLRRAIPAAGTWTSTGAERVEPFVPRTGEFDAVGRSGASVLKNSTLDPFLRNNDINTIVLLGFATHVCVESSLREAHDLGYNAWMVTDGCAAFDRTQHDHVCQQVVHHFGAATDADTLIERIEAG